jgi:hypothetical protein
MNRSHRIGRVAIVAAIAAAALPWAPPVAAAAAPAVVARVPAVAERQEMDGLLAARFGAPASSDMRVATSGAFRFVNAPEYLYLDRADTGSIAFELPRYGAVDAGASPAALAADRALERAEAALAHSGLQAEGRVFDGFQDEFAGTAPAGVAADFDPRAASTLVARTVAWRRELYGLPVFGSELIVGVMPDGSIGRFRLHWPRIDMAVVADALALQRAAGAQRWALPASLRGPEMTILDVRAGIVHPGISEMDAPPQAVVRVTYRKQSTGTDLPLSSTGYRYFDARGEEVKVGGFPRMAGTPAERKHPR